MVSIAKAISGHTNRQKVKSYLEKRNRALARDFFNLSWDERNMEGYDETMKDAVEWADEMDATRVRCGNDEPYEGRRARTYKHFIISPDPDDHIDLPARANLRERGPRSSLATTKWPSCTTTTTRTGSRMRT